MDLAPKDRFPDLFQILELMSASYVDGVPGVMMIDSGNPGPCVGITACTHGNEPSGLASIGHLLTLLRPRGALLNGRVCLTVNDLQAARAYFDGTDEGRAHRYRFIDTNMNRLPRELDESDTASVEIRRAKELLPLWRTFDVGLDIHSTSQETTPMIVSAGRTVHTALVHGFPIATIISNIDQVQIGLPASGFYGRGSGSDTPVIGIESGSHEHDDSFRCATECAEALLRNLGMVEGSHRDLTREYEEYVVFRSIVFPDSSYRLTRGFANFEFVPPGTLLASGDGPDFVTDRPCHTIFSTGPDHVDTWNSTTEEALFLLEPPHRFIA